MLNDIEIAQQAKMKKIFNIAKTDALWRNTCLTLNHTFTTEI